MRGEDQQREDRNVFPQEAVEQSRRSWLRWTFGSVFLGLFLAVAYTAIRYLLPKDDSQGSALEGGPYKIAEAAAVPPGRSLKFNYAGTPSILVNLEGRYLAYGAICTHLGCIVHWMDEAGCRMPMGDEIHCVCHAGHYSVTTGEVLAGPPPSPLPRLNVSVRDGRVYALGWADEEYVRRLTTYQRA